MDGRGWEGLLGVGVNEKAIKNFGKGGRKGVGRRGEGCEWMK